MCELCPSLTCVWIIFPFNALKPLERLGDICHVVESDLRVLAPVCDTVTDCVIMLLTLDGKVMRVGDYVVVWHEIGQILPNAVLLVNPDVEVVAFLDGCVHVFYRSALNVCLGREKDVVDVIADSVFLQGRRRA